MTTETVTTATTTVATTTAAGVVEHKLLGETYAFWCQTLVLLAAAIFAYIQIRSSRAIERRKAAAEALFFTRQDKELTDARRYIAVLHASDKNMASYARDNGQDNAEALRHIRYALNHYEYVSVAIAQGIYDETIFKHASHRTITQLYHRTKPFIDEMRRRNGTDTTWQEFECLAVRWTAKPLKVKSIKAVENTGFWSRIFGS